VRRVVVTGAQGFIGRALLDALALRGDRPVGIDLVGSADTLVGDVTDAHGDWQRALEGADALVHTAAIVAEAGDRRRFEAVNVGGTRAVCEAAARAGIAHVVHLSSIVVHGPHRSPGVLLDEDADRVATGAPYTDTKIASEDAALEVAGREGLAVTIVRPGDVYGARSVPWVLRPLELMRRRLFVHVDGGRPVLSPVHVDDLVAGVLAVIDRPRARGRTYALAGSPVATRDFFSVHAAAVGRRPPSLPAAVLRPAVRLAAGLARPAGVTLPFSAEAIEYVSHRGGYDTSRAARELDWTPRVALRPGLDEVVAQALAAGATRP